MASNSNNFKIRFETEVATTNAKSQIQKLITEQKKVLAKALNLDIKVDKKKIDDYFNNLNTKIRTNVPDGKALKQVITEIQVEGNKAIKIVTDLNSKEKKTKPGEYFSPTISNIGYKGSAGLDNSSELSKLNMLLRIQKTLKLDLIKLNDAGYGGTDYHKKLVSDLKYVNEHLKKYKELNIDAYNKSQQMTSEKIETLRVDSNIKKQREDDKIALDSMKSSYRNILNLETERMKISKEMSEDRHKQTPENQNLVANYTRTIDMEKKNIALQSESLKGTRAKTEAIKLQKKFSDDLVTSQTRINAIGSERKTFFADIGAGFKDAAARVLDYTAAYRALWFVIQKVSQSIDVIFELNKVFTDIQMVTEYSKEQIYGLANAYTELAKQMGVTVQEVAEGSTEWLNKIGRLYRNI